MRADLRFSSYASKSWSAFWKFVFPAAVQVWTTGGGGWSQSGTAAQTSGSLTKDGVWEGGCVRCRSEGGAVGCGQWGVGSGRWTFGGGGVPSSLTRLPPLISTSVDGCRSLIPVCPASHAFTSGVRCQMGQWNSIRFKLGHGTPWVALQRALRRGRAGCRLAPARPGVPSPVKSPSALIMGNDRPGTDIFDQRPLLGGATISPRSLIYFA